MTEKLLVKQTWEDCTIGFICPMCGEVHVADSQDGPITCTGGVTYQLVAILKITVPEEINTVSNK